MMHKNTYMGLGVIALIMSILTGGLGLYMLDQEIANGMTMIGIITILIGLSILGASLKLFSLGIGTHAVEVKSKSKN